MVHVHRHVEQMVQAACRYVTDGLRRGEAVIIVVTRAHWARMVGALAMQAHIDLAEAVMNGQLRHMDAELVLCGLLENGMPNGNRFDERAGNLVETALRRFHGVRIFTELAGMLWNTGNRLAAIRLEELWNGLAARLPLGLLCTYLTDGNERAEYNSPLKCVVDAHSHLVPAAEGRPERP